MKKVIAIVVFSLACLIGVIGVIMYFNYQNQEVELSEAIEAKLDDRDANFTKMWEVIQQKAGVSSEYAKQFKEIYPELIAGRYNNGGGQMMQWIVEHNPQFDSSLYKDVMMSIESQRESFYVNQQQLIDLNRQHEVLLKRVPSKWFLRGIPSKEFEVIKNEQAVQARETGREPKMELFKS